MKKLIPSHSGHRQRLKKKAKLLGLENLEKHEALELMLFFFIPRRNTNTLSHLLLQKFGSLQNILGADFTDLLSVPGMTEKAARFLSLSKGYADNFLHCLCDAEEVWDKVYLPQDEEAVVFFLDGNKKIKTVKALHKENVSPKTFAESIAAFSVKLDWKNVAVLYRGNNPYPETWDIEFIIELDYLLQIQEINILDIAKICKKAYYSFFKFRYRENVMYELY